MGSEKLVPKKPVPLDSLLLPLDAFLLGYKPVAWRTLGVRETLCFPDRGMQWELEAMLDVAFSTMLVAYLTVFLVINCYRDMAASINWGWLRLVGVLKTRALLFWVYIKGPDFGRLSHKNVRSLLKGCFG